MLISSPTLKLYSAPAFAKKLPGTKNHEEKRYNYLSKVDYDDYDYEDTFESRYHITSDEKPEYKSEIGIYSVTRLTGSLDNAKEKVRGKNLNQVLNLIGIEYVPIKNIEKNRLHRIKDTVDLSKNAKALNEFCTISTDYRYSDLQINEDDILDGVEIVLGDFNLRNTDLKSTKELKYIGGELVIGRESRIEDLSSIQKIEKSILVEANTKEEAIKILKRKKLNLKILTSTNPIILLPVSNHNGVKNHNTRLSN